MPACSFCGKQSDELKHCQRCRSVLYCDTVCQKNDWKSKHKNVCIMVPPSNEEGNKKLQNKEIKIRKNTADTMTTETAKEILNDKQDCLLTAGKQPLATKTNERQGAPGVTVPNTCTTSESKLMTSQIMANQLVQTRNENVSAQRCAYCHNTGENMRKCSRCKLMFYCGKICQELDWKLAHSKICRPVA